MPKHEFEELAANAAAGLRNDQELFLDVKLELQSHLDDKAEQFARDGHSPAESRELAGKSFGSPMDVAAEILAANKRRMRFRSLMRLTLGALLVPVAVLMALYAGYGRMVRLQELGLITNSLVGAQQGSSIRRLPALPFQKTSVKKPSARSLARALGGGHDNIASIRGYWETHQDEPDSHKYYAYYALFLDAKLDKNYVEAMRLGEHIEPENALYNINLANYYLDRGMRAKMEKSDDEEQTDTLLDRRAFEAGITELRKAAAKPYLRTYQAEVIRKKRNSLPQPRLTEDYMAYIGLATSELFPQFITDRNLARKIPGCARILHAEGRTAEAEAVMDTWEPYARFLTADNRTMYIQVLVASAAAKILTKEAPDVYEQLGARAKAEESRRAFKQFESITQEWHAGQERNRKYATSQLRQHGSTIATILFPVFCGDTPTGQELAPGRMHEHVMAEEGAMNVLLVLLVLALIGTLAQGVVWLYRLRRAGSVPILLLPPTKVVARAILLGVALPVVAYWLYSRMPVSGGREFSLTSYMWPRFAAEMLVVAIIVLWLPSHILRKYIRRRCGELEIPVPEVKDEAATNRRVRAAVFAGLVLVGAAIFAPVVEWPHIRAAGVAMGVVLIIWALLYARDMRKDYGLYYGTVARSLAPLYALSVLLLSLTAQPWLVYNEAKCLRNDTLIYGHLADRRSETVSFTAIEMRATQDYSDKLLKALDDVKK